MHRGRENALAYSSGASEKGEEKSFIRLAVGRAILKNLTLFRVSLVERYQENK